MLDCGRNLPPDVKRYELRDGAARKQQNLAHLQCIDSQRLKTNALIECSISHKVESRPCNVSARDFDLVRIDGSTRPQQAAGPPRLQATKQRNCDQSRNASSINARSPIMPHFSKSTPQTFARPASGCVQR
jgi:hypothetical protein